MILRVILGLLLVVGTSQAAIVGIKCTVDQRPSDGLKQEYIIKKNSDGTYGASFVQTGRFQWGAAETTKTQVLMTKADCALDEKELVGDCEEIGNKDAQKYLLLTSRVSRFYDRRAQKVLQSPVMLDIRFDDFSLIRPNKLEDQHYEVKTQCALLSG